jgi:hypothetical protein
MQVRKIWIYGERIYRSNRKKMKAEDLFIGAWVSVEEKPVEVRMISRRKIGYHRDGDKTRLVYARLADVEPLRVEKVEFGIDEWRVNGEIRIKIRGGILSIEVTAGDEESIVRNIFGERLALNTKYVHEMQRVLKIISGL